MSDSNLAPVCGLYCGTCTFLGSQCRGCGHVEGRPFWTSQMKIALCPLYDFCCRSYLFRTTSSAARRFAESGNKMLSISYFTS